MNSYRHSYAHIKDLGGPATVTVPVGRPLRIAVIPGDGIGPEVVREGLKVLEAVGSRTQLPYELTHLSLGADHYLATGELATERALTQLADHDAIYFGAIGDPRVPPRVLERGVLFAITSHFDLSISVRPSRLHAAHLTPLKGVRTGDIDLVIVREAAEDVFALPGGSLRVGTPAEVSVGTVIFTRPTVETVIRYGFELARRRAGRRRVTVVDQSNAAAVFDIWSRVLTDTAEEFCDVQAEREAPDAFAMRLLTQPQRYDVVVTSWMLGGIFADMAAALVGGLGLSGSARISPAGLSLFEPTHGSAPKHAGRDTASPLGAINALAMLLEQSGAPHAARLVSDAVALVLRRKSVPSLDTRSGVGTSDQGDLVVAAVHQLADGRADDTLA